MRLLDTVSMKMISLARGAAGLGLLLLTWGGGAGRARANPIGPSVTQGKASFGASGSQLTVNTSDRAFINWQSFNIAPGETTTFVQPSSSSVVWNQITDPNPSRILGTLNANGYVVLQNSSGFYVGGQASISTHGLIMTTASTPPFDLSNGGAWQFDAPPPTAKIVNYGKIQIDGGGSAFLIAHDIQNNGTISDLNGKVGLYAGKKVLVSTSPDGRGLSAEVTVPEGLVDNKGQLKADGGRVALGAQVVNQEGLIQADAARQVNGAIELVGSDAATLGPGSVISAQGEAGDGTPGGSVSIQSGQSITVARGAKVQADGGRIALSAKTVSQDGLLRADSVKQANGVVEVEAGDNLSLGADSVVAASGDATSTDPSPGGFAVLKSDNTFADTAGSKIAVSGQAGGQGGVVEVFGDGLTAAALHSDVGKPFALMINPYDLTLDSGASDVSAPSPELNVGDLSAYSQIDLRTLNNIELSASWTLADPGIAAALGLTAGNNIILDKDAAIAAQKDWSVDMTAGAGLPDGTAPTPGNDGIYLNSGPYNGSHIQTVNGDIRLFAPNEVQVGWTGQSSSAGVANNGIGYIATTGGGNIQVTTLYGDINAGQSPNGFNFSLFAPYYTPTAPGGISTVGGGDVTLLAGGDVISDLPTGMVPRGTGDAGSGAFGNPPGNVNIQAGGSVYGHYVVVNGAGTIKAGQDIGNASQNVALSLVKGGWDLTAANGDIHLQEARNPNGVFNNTATRSPGYHYFDYDPRASIALRADHGGVYVTGQSLPRPPATGGGSDDVPVLLPPILDIEAGAGGVVLQNDMTLFPSPNQNLRITTIDGGGLNGNGRMLLMSDSSKSRWLPGGLVSGAEPFSPSDHAAAPPEMNNQTPVRIHVAGNIENVRLQTSKQTRITVDGNMVGASFYGANLHAGDVTSIDVKGRIYNAGSFNYVTLDQPIPDLPPRDLPPSSVDNWSTILNLLVDPTITNYKIPGDVPPSHYVSYLARYTPYFLFGGDGTHTTLAREFGYDSSGKRLSYIGSMPQTVRDALEHPLTVLRYGPDGNPLVDSSGHFVTDTLTWVDPAKIERLYAASQGAPGLSSVGGGYFIGGPGDFDIHAGHISLGNAYGILSLGNGQYSRADYSYLKPLLQGQRAATINVTVDGNLEMPSSTIASLGGGDVNVRSTGGSMDLGSQYLVQFEAQIMEGDNLGLGIYTTGGGNVNVTASGDINVDSSRIAAFNGGNVRVLSEHGDVNAGTGGSTAVPVNYFPPGEGAPYLEYVYANGIVADTLAGASRVPSAASLPGNITVSTPEGSIYASRGGILQEALNGNLAAGPTVTLTAGTPPSTTSKGYIGNVDLGKSGVIGGTVNVTASGTVSGLLISRQNANVNAAQSFSGTVLSGGTATLSAGGAVSGTIIGATGVSAFGGGGVSASLLGQNVSVNGGAGQSTLGIATASSVSQGAAGQTSSETQQQVAENDLGGASKKKKKKKKKPVLVRAVKRVTVILPKGSK